MENFCWLLQLGYHEITNDHAPEALGNTVPAQISWQLPCLETGLQVRTDFKVQRQMIFKYSQLLHVSTSALAVWLS